MTVGTRSPEDSSRASGSHQSLGARSSSTPTQPQIASSAPSTGGAKKTRKSDRATGGRKYSRQNRPSPRERLLASATNLFTSEGIRVIGIDRVLKEADVAKASLYSLFGSKDNLVIAYLENLDQQWREKWFQRTAMMTSPEDKILAFFDISIEEEPAKEYRGSYFHNAATEYPHPATPVEQGIIDAVVEHRRWCHTTITELLNKKNGYPSGSQAEEILLFLDGGLAGATLARSTRPLMMARDLAKELLGAPPADYSI